ncbi:TetR/AcrR family transcriptional regulator [Maricaulis sp.]|uniref:TetR/AcrR family transcriptional regulator n=1 Tax=Maricaulis sp. TaxID=1486257 RepID=UPI00262AB772|nr:TetR/AcrR family transcriptional regulator [Maricaulis sp.]
MAIQAGGDAGADKGRQSGRRSQQERTETSDQRMLDAARDMILAVGTQRTTLKEVGERAGYSRGLANARFGSKDQLFLRLADRARQYWITALEDSQGSTNGLAALISRLDAIVGFAEAQPAEARVMYTLWFESVGTPSPINASLARFHEQARADIADLARAAGLARSEDEAGRFATRFIGTVFGLCYQWLVNEEAVDIASHMDDLKRDLLDRAGRS